MEKRKYAHANDEDKKGLDFVIAKDNLTYEEARGLEQILMIEYSTLDYLNRINGISPRNKNLSLYMAAARDVCYNYFSNQISNEALYWAGY